MARRCFLAVPAAALIVQGCGEEPAVPVTDFGPPRATEPEFEFGESLGGGSGAGFGLISAVRVLGDGDLILVAEGASQRATLWTPDGSPIREVGRPGEGPGEFAGRFRVQVHREGFFAIDDLGRRFTSFSNDGTFRESVPFPTNPLGGAGLRYTALLEDGSVFAIPKFSPLEMLGFDGNPPIESLPVVLLPEEDGLREIDTVAVLDTRNRALVITPQGTPAIRGIQSEQIFGDHDLVWFDGVAGSVVVVRRNPGPGAAGTVRARCSARSRACTRNRLRGDLVQWVREGGFAQRLVRSAQEWRPRRGAQDPVVARIHGNGRHRYPRVGGATGAMTSAFSMWSACPRLWMRRMCPTDSVRPSAYRRSAAASG